METQPGLGKSLSTGLVEHGIYVLNVNSLKDALGKLSDPFSVKATLLDR